MAIMMVTSPPDKPKFYQSGCLVCWCVLISQINTFTLHNIILLSCNYENVIITQSRRVNFMLKRQIIFIMGTIFKNSCKYFCFVLYMGTYSLVLEPLFTFGAIVQFWSYCLVWEPECLKTVTLSFACFILYPYKFYLECSVLF